MNAKLPKLWRRKRDGKEFGAYHVSVRNKPVNLCTDILELARERRLDAVKRGVRKWPRKFAPKAPKISNHHDGTADALAAVGEVAPELPTYAGTNDPGTAGGDGSAQTPPPAADVPVIEPEPIPQAPPPAGDWAGDLGAAATADAPPPDAAPAGLRLQDFPWFDSALVTLSKAAVGLQLVAQAWTMRLLGDVEAGRVGPPPKPAPPDGAEGMAAFMAAAGARWDASDPREPGRQAYERTALALIPEIVTLPAWFRWVEAPLVTAIHTVPVQLAGATPVKRDADGKPAAPDAPQPEEAPPGERAAA